MKQLSLLALLMFTNTFPMLKLIGPRLRHYIMRADQQTQSATLREKPQMHLFTEEDANQFSNNHGPLVSWHRSMQIEDKAVFVHDRTSIREILEQDLGYSFECAYFGKILSRELCAETLKKIMALVQAHALPDVPSEYDWTRGKFIALSSYFTNQAIINDKDATAEQKRCARAAILGITREYEIAKENVTLDTRDLAPASRIQE